MATRTIWKGAISFGLVHIPVALHTATRDSGIDFDWLDRRTMDPVGYRRINKRTGKAISREDIVKGVEYEDGEYVVLSADEIEDAYPRTTQTIQIERFIQAAQLSFVYLERPYYIQPINKSHKVYALLRDTLVQTGKLALARVVIQTKQHLAALIPSGDALILNLMRWGDEIKPPKDLDLPETGSKKYAPSAAERKMARMLVDDMSGDWDPDAFRDEFQDAIMALVEEKAEAGQTETVLAPQEEAPTLGENVIDLTELLKRSLQGRTGADQRDDDQGGPRKPARRAAASAADHGSSTHPSAAKKAAKKTAKKAAGKKAGAKAATAKTAGGGAKKPGKSQRVA